MEALQNLSTHIQCSVALFSFWNPKMIFFLQRVNKHNIVVLDEFYSNLFRVLICGLKHIKEILLKEKIISVSIHKLKLSKY